ncbi:MAG: hypothetical protein AB8G16_00025 [Gammaproteobacteria bacterium]
MESSTTTQERHYQPSPRVRAFRMAFGLLLLTVLIAVGVQP